jgi:hypothetical protein
MQALALADEQLRNSFIQVYPQLRAAAPQRLGTLYDPNDFPDVADLPAKFSVKLTFTPVPDVKDFRLDVTAEAANDLREQLEADQAGKLQSAVRDCYQRMVDVVERISQTLAKEDPRIFDTLVSNARQVADCVADLNITNDPQLEVLREELSTMLPTSARALKHDPDLRKRVKDDADALLAKMTGFV